MRKLFFIFLVLLIFSCEKSKSGNIQSVVQNEPDSPIINTEEIRTSTINLTVSDTLDFEYIDSLNDLDRYMYLESNRFAYFSTIKTPNIDFSLIRTSNAVVTNEFSFPDISSMHIGLDSDLPNSLVTRNHILRTSHGNIYAVLRKDTDIDKNIYIIVKNGLNEFVYPERILIEKIISEYDDNEYLGYYTNINFEHKPWFNNYADENIWNIIVKADNEELINENVEFDFSYLLFKDLDSSPFILNGLSTVNIDIEYNYRFYTQDGDIIVIYYSFPAGILPYTIFRPILYLLPNKSSGRYTDITISWTDEELKGIYHIRRYKLNNLPNGNEETIVFPNIYVR